jgi:hypothetical protein
MKKKGDAVNKLIVAHICPPYAYGIIRTIEEDKEKRRGGKKRKQRRLVVVL